MLYNLLESHTYRQNAGKVTIATSLVAISVFAFVFLFNAGKTELLKVEAQTASTTLTVLNTPPQWVASSTEVVESSATNPTNSGDVISWTAVATDPNQPNYYLLICQTNDAPSSTNGGAPSCNGGVQWGVSAPTPVGTPAVVSTTTTEVSPFAESNDWYAWICDDDAVSARCNSSFTNGTNATNSSPFFVNFRPIFDTISSDSPANPSETITFTASSSDPNGDTVTLIVCSTNGYSTTTNTCDDDTLATTTVPVVSGPTAVYTVPSIIRDDFYDAYVFIIDEFNHEAIGGQQGANEVIEVLNVAPTVAGGTISLNGGSNIILTNGGSETTGFTLDFVVSDANSCSNTTGLPATEVVDYGVSLFRGSLGTSTCSAFDGGDYDPNNCYTSSVPTTTWALSCTASSTSCTADGVDDTILFNCTFPLWFVADPTNDVNSPFDGDHWVAAIAGIDDDSATGTQSIGSSPVPLNSLSVFDLQQAEIPYGELEPGQDMSTLSASTTILSLGNTGLDQNLTGESMCGTFAVGSPCPSSASSTIPENRQEFATSSIAYGTGTDLSSTTPQELELNIPKSTSTTTPESRPIYWGIGVPIDITLAGAYTGLNSFSLVVSEPLEW